MEAIPSSRLIRLAAGGFGDSEGVKGAVVLVALRPIPNKLALAGLVVDLIEGEVAPLDVQALGQRLTYFPQPDRRGMDVGSVVVVENRQLHFGEV